MSSVPQVNVGHFAGELAVLSQSESVMNVVAAENTLVMRIPGDFLQSRLGKPEYQPMLKKLVKVSFVQSIPEIKRVEIFP